MGRLMKVHSDNVTTLESSLNWHVFKISGRFLSLTFILYFHPFPRSFVAAQPNLFLKIALISYCILHKRPIWIIEMCNKVQSLFSQSLIGFQRTLI